MCDRNPETLPRKILAPDAFLSRFPSARGSSRCCRGIWGGYTARPALGSVCHFCCHGCELVLRSGKLVLDQCVGVLSGTWAQLPPTASLAEILDENKVSVHPIWQLPPTLCQSHSILLPPPAKINTNNEKIVSETFSCMFWTFPSHRNYVCMCRWMQKLGHPLGKIMKEKKCRFTANVYLYSSKTLYQRYDTMWLKLSVHCFANEHNDGDLDGFHN